MESISYYFLVVVAVLPRLLLQPGAYGQQVASDGDGKTGHIIGKETFAAGVYHVIRLIPFLYGTGEYR